MQEMLFGSVNRTNIWKKVKSFINNRNYKGSSGDNITLFLKVDDEIKLSFNYYYHMINNVN